MNFRIWLETVDLNFWWINPDTLYNDEESKGFTFIYTQEHGLFTASKHTTHKEIKKMHPELSGGIEGRCGTVYHRNRMFIISVWSSRGNLQELLDPCIEAIRHKIGIIGMPVVLSTEAGNKLIDDNQQPFQGPKVSQADIELLRSLHTMKSPEKLAARKKLGLWGPKLRQDAEDRVLQPEQVI